MSFDNRSSAVEGNSSSNPEMQTLCKTGCGFYGNPVQEGLCSKCHKDKVKHLQQNLPSNSSSTACVVNSTVQSEARFLRNSSSSLLVSSKHEKSSESSGGGAVSPHRETSEDQQRTSEPVVEQASPELLTAATNSIVISSTESTAYTELEASTAKPKNRCLACNKRVGLTGFGCRCGGLFCSTHRYSDMHGCSFDYKEHAQGQIRKNNPVVMGSKITKI